MITIHTHRPSEVFPTYEVTFKGSGKVLQSLLNKLKIARAFDTELKNELNPSDIDANIRQLIEGR